MALCFPRSAGATLRRYNEGALVAEIRHLIGSWDTHIKEASCIFLRTPKTNKAIFVGEKGFFPRNDPRLREIPFLTRRPTFREVRAAHVKLATLYTVAESRMDMCQSELDVTGGGVASQDGGREVVVDENMVTDGRGAEVEEEVNVEMEEVEKKEEEEEKDGASLSNDKEQGNRKKKKLKNRHEGEEMKHSKWEE